MILDLEVVWRGCVRHLLVVVVWIVCFKLGERLKMMIKDRGGCHDMPERWTMRRMVMVAERESV